MNLEEENYCKAIGGAIRALRIKHTGKSVCIFAYENDVPRSTLSRIEIGQNEARLITLKKIANGFGWELSELFEKIEEYIQESNLTKSPEIIRGKSK